MAVNPTRKGTIREENQKRILLAAVDEFEKHGFGGARMQRIADRAEMPKANIHYYYKNKLELYLAVLNDITQLWNNAFDRIDVNDDPATALEVYIRAKLEYSRTNPAAARIFSSEIIQGAPHLRHYLKSDLRDWVNDRASVIRHWHETGKIRVDNPVSLIFLIWSATQHYADYHAQIAAIYGKERLSTRDFQLAADSLVDMILRACGLERPTRRH